MAQRWPYRVLELFNLLTERHFLKIGGVLGTYCLLLESIRAILHFNMAVNQNTAYWTKECVRKMKINVIKCGPEVWSQSIKKLWTGTDYHLPGWLKLNPTVWFSALILLSLTKMANGKRLLGCVLRSLKAQCDKLTSIQFSAIATKGSWWMYVSCSLLKSNQWRMDNAKLTKQLQYW